MIISCALASCAIQGYDGDSAVVQRENVKSSRLLEDLHGAGLVYKSDRFDQLSRKILRRLYPQRHTHYRVRLARLPDYNAFALPEGEIVLHLGLLAMLENEDQLAFVLAHEIAHIDAQDSYSSAYHRRRVRIKAQLVDILSFGSGASYAHYATQLRSANRRQEMSADSTAARVVQQAGYDVSAAADFFALLQHTAEQGGIQQSDSTHPPYASRQNLLKQFHARHPQQQSHHAFDKSSVHDFDALRTSILPSSVEDKIEELAFLNALQQIDSLDALGGDANLIRCLRGKVFAGMAQTDPESFIYAMNERYVRGMEDHAIVPQVYDAGAERKYFHAKALGEFLSVINSGRSERKAHSLIVVSNSKVAASQSAEKEVDKVRVCAIRGAGLSGHALGHSSLATHYLSQYLQLAPGAIDARYIRDLQATYTEL